MILKFLKIIVIFLLQIYSKRTGKIHQSLVISTLEYIPKQKGRKRTKKKKVGLFVERFRPYPPMMTPYKNYNRFT